MARTPLAPDIAFAASARPWPDRLHRFVLDHGGGRIVDRVLTADQIEDLRCEAILIDDVCSFLTPNLVQRLKGKGVEVVGVFAPEDGSHAKRRLLECGISDVIEADATPEEFLAKVSSTLDHRAVGPDLNPPRSSILSIGVTSATEGVGVTEVAVGLAFALSRRTGAVLVDLDQNWPSVAQRLGLAVHPNLLTVLDAVLHRSRHSDSGMLTVEGLHIVGGRADLNRGISVGKAEILSLMYWLPEVADVAVADLGPLSRVPPGVAREFSTLIAVGSPDPVGVGRVSTVVESLRDRDQSVVAVLNQTRRGSYVRSEAVAELGRVHPTLPILTLPYGREVADAAWNGEPVGRGRFSRGLEAMADLIEKAVL